MLYKFEFRTFLSGKAIPKNFPFPRINPPASLNFIRTKVGQKTPKASENSPGYVLFQRIFSDAQEIWKRKTAGITLFRQIFKRIGEGKIPKDLSISYKCIHRHSAFSILSPAQNASYKNLSGNKENRKSHRILPIFWRELKG